MNHNKERNNFVGNDEEIGNKPTASNTNQGTSDFGEAAAEGTFTDAVAGAMIGAPFGLIGAVVGGVSGGLIGNQMVENAEEDNHRTSNNQDVSK
jgi:phage tail tape-measure protein